MTKQPPSPYFLPNLCQSFYDCNLFLYELLEEIVLIFLTLIFFQYHTGFPTEQGEVNDSEINKLRYSSTNIYFHVNLFFLLPEIIALRTKISQKYEWNICEDWCQKLISYHKLTPYSLRLMPPFPLPKTTTEYCSNVQSRQH